MPKAAAAAAIPARSTVAAFKRYFPEFNVGVHAATVEAR
jgi:hypothetical protein